MFKWIKENTFAFMTICLMVFLSAAAMHAEAAIMIKPPKINAKSYVLMEADSGRILSSEEVDTKYPPASLTKMMTAYIIEHEINAGRMSMDDMVPISVKAWKTDGSRMFVREGTTVKLSDLLRGVIIQSGNDASVALAEYAAGSEEAFADLMNQHAARLGMKNSHFVNSTGLPADDHYSTAHDLAILARAIIRDFPEHYEIYGEKEFKYNNIKQLNRNKLIFTDESVDGLKTGYTQAAKYCLVASAKRDGLRIITVVMGTDSVKARIQESQKLIAYGFRAYGNYPLYKALDTVADVDLIDGVKETLAIGVEDDIELVLGRGQEEEVSGNLNINEEIEAPIKRGQVIGTLSVKHGDVTLKTVNVVALENVERAGFFSRLWSAISRFFSNLFS